MHELTHSDHLGQSVKSARRLGCIRWMDMKRFTTFC